MMALPLAYELVMGRPLVFWMGILTAMFLFSAGIVMFLNMYAKGKYTVNLHKKLAIAGLVLAALHIMLALSIYF